MAAPSITPISPADGGTISEGSGVASAQLAPPGAVAELWDRAAGVHLGTVQSDASGLASIIVRTVKNGDGTWYPLPGPWSPVGRAGFGGAASLTTGALAQATFQPGGGVVAGGAAGLVPGVKLTAAGAVATGGQASMTAMGGQASFAPAGGMLSGGAASLVPGVKLTAAGSVAAGGSAALTTVAADTTAPVAGTLTVPSGTAGTAMTTINPGTCTDAVGITGWAILDQAADSGWPATLSALTSAGATWNTITATTSWAPGATLSYTPATAGSPRYFKLYLRDAAGNLTASATASATVAGGGTSVSDTFTGSTGSGLGANWTTITGLVAPVISSNRATAAGTGACGARWSANTFANNQFSEARWASLAPDTGLTNGPACRISAGAKTYYGAYCYQWSEDGLVYWQLYKVVSGTFTQLGAEVQVNDPICRLECNGTTISLKSAATHGGAYTTRITVTDSAIASGSAGITVYVQNGDALDDWYGGDL